MPADTDIAWRPDPQQAAASNLSAFMRSLGVASYEDLLRRADAEPGWFFEGVLKHIDYRFYGLTCARWTILAAQPSRNGASAARPMSS